MAISGTYSKLELPTIYKAYVYKALISGDLPPIHMARNMFTRPGIPKNLSLPSSAPPRSDGALSLSDDTPGVSETVAPLAALPGERRRRSRRVVGNWGL